MGRAWLSLCSTILETPKIVPWSLMLGQDPVHQMGKGHGTHNIAHKENLPAYFRIFSRQIGTSLREAGLTAPRRIKSVLQCLVGAVIEGTPEFLDCSMHQALILLPTAGRGRTLF